MYIEKGTEQWKEFAEALRKRGMKLDGGISFHSHIIDCEPTSWGEMMAKDSKGRDCEVTFKAPRGGNADGSLVGYKFSSYGDPLKIIK